MDDIKPLLAESSCGKGRGAAVLWQEERQISSWSCAVIASLGDCSVVQGVTGHLHKSLEQKPAPSAV